MSGDIKRVALLGLDPRSAEALELAFKHRAEGRCVLCDEDEAQVVVADFDNPTISAEYAALRNRRPNVPVIAVCSEEPNTGGVAHLSKPVTIGQLVELVETLTQAVKEVSMAQGLSNDKIEQAMKAIEARRAAASLEGRVGKTRDQRSDLKRGLASMGDAMYFDSERFLLGHVHKAFAGARETGKPVALTCLQHETIAFDPVSDTVVTSLTDIQIRSLAIAPTDDELALPIEACPHEGPIADLPGNARRRLFSAEVFLWNLGFLTSRGRLPHGVSPDERVYLRRWPNLTRTVVPPNTMRIIAYWIQQPCELLRMYEILGVSMEDVFAVYTAAEAAGLAGVVERKADALMDTFEIPENRKRGVFSAILKRLTKRVEKDQNVA